MIACLSMVTTEECMFTGWVCNFPGSQVCRFTNSQVHRFADWRVCGLYAADYVGACVWPCVNEHRCATQHNTTRMTLYVRASVGVSSTVAHAGPVKDYYSST